MFKKHRLKWKFSRLRAELEKDANKLALKYKTVKFIITNGEIIHEEKKLYGAFDSNSQRIYIKHIPSIRVESFISQLIEISKLHSVKAIQIEFDRYNEQFNIEAELYLEIESFLEQQPNINFPVQDGPCDFTVSERFYNDLINSLKKKSN
ncbi:hypothetical protein ACQKNX_23170 [Lysinibacillus sp. NPDC093712]|uniref:hypothetical protein n=1 Tax=Lysinibacillus sp. NPDC093712 TaxID=3390579 RepID=UPI003D018B5A